MDYLCHYAYKAHISLIYAETTIIFPRTILLLQFHYDNPVLLLNSETKLIFDFRAAVNLNDGRDNSLDTVCIMQCYANLQKNYNYVVLDIR